MVRVKHDHSVVPPGRGPALADDCILARYLKERGLRKVDAAVAMHCTERAVWNYMRRVRKLPLRMLGPLCDLLDLDPVDLVDEQGYLRAGEV